MMNTEERVTAEAARAYSPEIWLQLLAPDRMPRQRQTGRTTAAHKPGLRRQLQKALLSLRSLQ